MDAGTVVVLVLASIIILAAIAIIAQALSTHRKSSAEAYSVRMNANAAIVERMAGRNDHAIDIDYAGVLTVTPREISTQADTPAAEQIEIVTDDEIKAWKLALDLVTASVAANPDGNQLIAASAFGSGSGYESATALLKSRGWIMTVTGGRGAGAFVRDEIGTVKALLPKVALEGAIRSLPHRQSVNA